MNIRTRQQMRALELREVEPIMAILRSEKGKFDTLLLIRPDHWDEAKAEYGNRLRKFLEDEDHA